MGEIDISEVGRKIYGSRYRGRSNKNLYADLLQEVSSAMGFDLTLLKENRVKAGKYILFEEDLELHREIWEKAKSAEGKRLRCRDYVGAGGLLVDWFMNSLLYLAEKAGAAPELLQAAYLKMMTYTKNIVLRDCIRELTDEFEDDIEHRFFITEGDLEGQHCLDDDYISPEGETAFLQFLIANIDEAMEDIRGTYWFFKMNFEEKEKHRLFDEIGEFKKKDAAEKEQFKEDMMARLSFDKAVNEDEELGALLREAVEIEEGKGRLQDNKRKKGLAQEIADRLDAHARQYLNPLGQDSTDSSMGTERKTQNEYSEKCIEE